MSDENESSGALLARIAHLAAPIALSQLTVVAMSLVDTAVLGRSSVDDLAAVAIGRSAIFAGSAPAFGVGIAAETLTSQAVGAGEHGRAWGALVSTLFGCVIMTVVSVMLTFGIYALMPTLGVEARLLPDVLAYILGSLPGLVAFSGYFAARSYLQAYGSTKPIVLAAVSANIVNVIACSLLVLGDDALAFVGLPGVGLRGLGAAGAGLATSFGFITLFVVTAYGARQLRPREPATKVPFYTVLKLGGPIGAQLLAEIGVFALAALVAGRLGAHVVSAHQIALGLASFTFMGALGVAGATATVVGQAVGAGHRALRPGLLGIGLGALVMLLGAVVFATIPRALVGLFTADETILDVGENLLRIAAVFQLFDGVQAVASGALRGAGDVSYPLVANITAHWLIGLPTSLLFGFWLGLGAAGIWYGLTLGLITVAALLTLRFVLVARRSIARVT